MSEWGHIYDKHIYIVIIIFVYEMCHCPESDFLRFKCHLSCFGWKGYVHLLWVSRLLFKLDLADFKYFHYYYFLFISAVRPGLALLFDIFKIIILFLLPFEFFPHFLLISFSRNSWQLGVELLFITFPNISSWRNGKRSAILFFFSSFRDTLQNFFLTWVLARDFLTSH